MLFLAFVNTVSKLYWLDEKLYWSQLMHVIDVYHIISLITIVAFFPIIRLIFMLIVMFTKVLEEERNMCLFMGKSATLRW